MNVAEFRSGLRTWLDRTRPVPRARTTRSTAQVAQLARVRRALYDAGWMRYGWPAEVGGLGGPAVLRAVLGEEVATRDLAEPGIYSMVEVLAPTMISYARPDLAARDGAPAAVAAANSGARGSPSPARAATWRR